MGCSCLVQAPFRRVITHESASTNAHAEDLICMTCSCSCTASHCTRKLAFHAINDLVFTCLVLQICSSQGHGIVRRVMGSSFGSGSLTI